MDEKTSKKVSRALAYIPSGAFVVTARDGEHTTGMLASWVQQAGFDPPAITVAVKHGRTLEKLIEASKQFVVNIVGEDRTRMFRHFSKGFDPGEPVFKNLTTHQEPEGIVIQEDCVGYLQCRLAGSVDAGDHLIYVGHVVGGGASSGAKPYVHLRTNGLKY